MGFLFGLLMGTAIMSGGTQTQIQMQQMLSQIPLRCFAALDISDAAYRDCRILSMRAELNNQSRSNPTDTGACYYVHVGRVNILSNPKEWESLCDAKAAISMEIIALRGLEAHAKQQQSK